MPGQVGSMGECFSALATFVSPQASMTVTMVGIYRQIEEGFLTYFTYIFRLSSVGRDEMVLETSLVCQTFATYVANARIVNSHA